MIRWPRDRSPGFVLLFVVLILAARLPDGLAQGLPSEAPDEGRQPYLLMEDEADEEEEGEDEGEEDEEQTGSGAPTSPTPLAPGSATALPAAAAASFMGIFFIIYFVFIMLMVLMGVGGMILSALAVYDCARRDFDDPNTRAMWCLVIALTRLIGAIIYYFVIYRKDDPPIQAKRLPGDLPPPPMEAQTQ